MKIIDNSFLDDNKVKKNETEQVVREKKEFTLLGKYNLTKGFSLFCFNPISRKVSKIEIKRGEFIQCELVKFEDGVRWIWFDPENFNVSIDSRNIYFEALNISHAKIRVEKFKEGQIKDLFNLKTPKNGSIDIFKSL